jgi:NAD(P)-dependent dehydrogenase (short-subunit alcohol dehydrogenase family)
MNELVYQHKLAELKVCITGTTRGLGKKLSEHFEKKGYTVVGLNREDDIVKNAIGCHLFVNNTYGNGMQIDLFNQLFASVEKMIVMGSIAAIYPDPEMPVYSQHKRELKERVLDVATSPGLEIADILLLELTGKSYNDTELVTRTIDFWLENPNITSVSFVPGEPNR